MKRNSSPSSSLPKPVRPARRMDAYRQRMRAAGLRPVQMWVPDTRNPEFVELCRQQSLAVAASDPAGDELMRFIEGVYEWPEA